MKQMAASTMRRVLLIGGMMLTLSACVPFRAGMLGHGTSGHASLGHDDTGTRQIGHEDSQAQKTPLEILEERYARGELDRDTFLQMKHDLEN